MAVIVFDEGDNKFLTTATDENSPEFKEIAGYILDWWVLAAISVICVKKEVKGFIPC